MRHGICGNLGSFGNIESVTYRRHYPGDGTNPPSPLLLQFEYVTGNVNNIWRKVYGPSCGSWVNHRHPSLSCAVLLNRLKYAWIPSDFLNCSRGWRFTVEGRQSYPAIQ